jgi:divalent metal cation (Fe/Co/Zn/Cd) transporter
MATVNSDSFASCRLRSRRLGPQLYVAPSTSRIFNPPRRFVGVGIFCYNITLVSKYNLMMAHDSPIVQAISHISRPSSVAYTPGSSTPQPYHNDGISTALEPFNTSVDEKGPVSRHTATHVILNSDVEEQRSPQYTRENDPYQLSTKIKTTSEIDLIRANTSRKRDGCGPVTVNKEARKARKIQGFYESQNENIERLLKPVDEHRRQARAEQGANRLKFQIAVHGSFAANVILAVLQVYGAVSSGSLSLFTTMADALFDPLSNIMLILSHRAINRVDPRKFPSGKARIETAGNIVFCFLMCSVSFILIVLSIRELAEPPHDETRQFHLPSIVAVAIAFFTKLTLFCYCWALRNVYSQIRILWEDHRNDLFINGFGLLTSIGGSKLRWWIDPMGAIILSVLIAFLWLRTAYSEFQLLIGVTADTHMQQLVTYIGKEHSNLIIDDLVDSVHSHDTFTSHYPYRYCPSIS